jgi:hypothetical protein
MVWPKSEFEKRKRPSDPPYPRGIILDAIHPREFNALNIMFCCEQCSYFNTEKETCAMGFRTELHRRETQLRQYEMTGKVAYCRSMEID